MVTIVAIVLQFREQSRANMKELLIEVEEGRMTRSEVPTQEEMCGGGSEVCAMNGPRSEKCTLHKQTAQ